MGFFNEPLSSTFARLRTGVILLTVVAIIRFLAKPAFGLAYDDATHLVSLAWLLLILVTVYAVPTGRRGGNWKDYLANALVLTATTQVLIVVAIAVDEFIGIDTFYTDPDHGGSINPLVHMAAHLVLPTVVLTLVFTLWGWLCGTVVRRVARPA